MSEIAEAVGLVVLAFIWFMVGVSFEKGRNKSDE